MMRRHLNKSEIVDLALESGVSAWAGRHGEECASCRTQVEQARGALALARRAEVSDPEPAFWDSFSRRVGRAVRAEAPDAPAWRLRLGWAVGVAAILVLALPMSQSLRWLRSESPAPVWVALPTQDGAADLALLEEVLPNVTEDASCRGGQCLVDVSDDEGQAAVEMLRAELESKS
jgi:hypothetical protein